ncbi:MAG: methyltransferase domain-containing protein [Vicinamibacteria bacterium]|nr:methyltransferase domain-containing protein [Vicinamibacteria bacterium]
MSLRRAGAWCAAALLALPVVAQQGRPGGSGRFGNPPDLESYIAQLEEQGRAGWQKPDQVVSALGLKPGQTACDVGAGPGYFSLRLARAVGKAGRVFAVDVEPVILDALRDRVGQTGLTNVTPVLALPHDPLIPPGSCDLILIVNTYHHFPDGPAYLRRLIAALKPGGRIANIDFQKRRTAIGPPPEQRLAREDFLKEAAAGGLRLLAEKHFLPYQYFLLLTP